MYSPEALSVRIYYLRPFAKCYCLFALFFQPCFPLFCQRMSESLITHYLRNALLSVILEVGSQMLVKSVEIVPTSRVRIIT